MGVLGSSLGVLGFFFELTNSVDVAREFGYRDFGNSVSLLPWIVLLDSCNRDIHASVHWIEVYL